MVEPNEFQKLLDDSSYLNDGQKIIAYSLYVAASDKVRQEMVEFYTIQLDKHKMLKSEYEKKVEEARARFNSEVDKLIKDAQESSELP